MNYRHAFHAGNFADVLKHAVLVGLIEALKHKNTPFCVIDTHAGRARGRPITAPMPVILPRGPTPAGGSHPHALVREFPVGVRTTSTRARYGLG